MNIPNEQIATARLLVDTLAGKPFLNCEEHDTYILALKTLRQHITNAIVVAKPCSVPPAPTPPTPATTSGASA